jgi:hypothetical protein
MMTFIKNNPSVALTTAQINPDYSVLKDRWSALALSGPFRIVDQYPPLEDLFVRKVQENALPVKITQIGIAHLEESVSIVGMAAKVARDFNIPLEQLLNLTMVDLRPKSEIHPSWISKPYTEEDLDGSEWDPVTTSVWRAKKELVDACFQMNPKGNYSVPKEVRRFVLQTLNDPERTFLNTNAVDFVAGQPKNSVDVIFFNNVSKYVRSFSGRGGRKQFEDQAEALVKPGGLIAGDSCKSPFYKWKSVIGFKWLSRT